jgi:sphinganine C4-monooxygenase
MFNNSSFVAPGAWGSTYEDFVHLTPPFYYTPRIALLPFMSDYVLSMAIGVVLYWATALFYHGLDCSGWAWLEQYRIHDSEEMKSKNLVGKWTVIYTVLAQQAVQILLGVWWMEDEVVLGEERHSIARNSIQSAIISLMKNALGDRVGEALFAPRGEQVAYWLYWWGIPIAQFLFAM